jgi:hypothetical protein
MMSTLPRSARLERGLEQRFFPTTSFYDGSTVFDDNTLNWQVCALTTPKSRDKISAL